VAAACHDNGAIAGAGTHQKLLPGYGFIGSDLAFRRAPGSVAPEDAPDGRGIDDADDGNTIFNLGNVHREFAIAGNKFLGAVQGVHEIEFGSHLRNPASGGGFLGNDRGLRIELRETFEDNSLGRFVGLGHRREIGLGAGPEVGGIDRHDFAPRQKGKAYQ